MPKGSIWAVERNIRGAWVIYGALGVRQYYGYTKSEAKEKYKSECVSTIVEVGGNNGSRTQEGRKK